jgi:hypothetical protein
VAAAAGWFLHPAVAIAIFLAMIVYHTWTSQGIANQDIEGGRR